MSLLDSIIGATDAETAFSLTPDEFLERYRQENPERIAFDTESPTYKWHLPEAVPFALTFSWSREHTYYVPCSRGGALDQTAAEMLFEVLANTETVIGHHTKYDLHVAKRLLDNFGLPLVTRRIDDTMLLDAVLDEQRHHGLKERCTDLGIRFGDEDADTLKARVAAWRETAAAASGGREVGFDEVPAYLMVPYARQDAYLTLELYSYLMTEMEEQLGDAGRSRDLREIYELELRLLWVIFGMEERGMRVDLDFVFDQIRTLNPRMEEIKSRLRTALKWEINPGSTDDVAAALEQLGRGDAVWKNPETGKVNLPQWRLDELANDPNAGELVHLILEYRTSQKMLSSYYETLKDEHRLDDDGQAIVRCNVKQMGARTGRMSITEPALQTIPRDKGDVRAAFIAREGHVLIFADYSQQELRALAHYLAGPPIGDTGMADIFANETVDLHQETAAAIFRVPYDEVSGEQRRMGKNTNFAIVYGAGAAKIGRMHGINTSDEEARAHGKVVLDRLYGRFPGIRDLKRMCENAMSKRGYVITAFGRRHREKNGRFAYKAVNSLVQGTGADMTKAAMVRIDDAFQQDGLDAMIVLSVHDEIVVEAPESEADAAVQIIRRAMLESPEMSVPMEVDTVTSKSWGAK